MVIAARYRGTACRQRTAPDPSRRPRQSTSRGPSYGCHNHRHNQSNNQYRAPLHPPSAACTTCVPRREDDLDRERADVERVVVADLARQRWNARVASDDLDTICSSEQRYHLDVTIGMIPIDVPPPQPRSSASSDARELLHSRSISLAPVMMGSEDGRNVEIAFVGCCQNLGRLGWIDRSGYVRSLVDEQVGVVVLMHGHQHDLHVASLLRRSGVSRCWRACTPE